MTPRQLIQSLARFPWRSAAQTLRTRIGEDRLAQSAGSLTFTTTIALVPFFTVVLAVFTAFPLFSKLQGSLQIWLVQSLVPDAISRQVMRYLTQFAGQANRLGVVGLAVLLLTALSLVVTIDRTLNGIWRVRRPRPLGRQVLLYWAALTLGPLLMGASVSISSYVMSASRGFVAALPAVVLVVLDWFELLLLAGGLAALYRFVPNAPVRARHAWAGGVFAALGIELARQLLALYIEAVPAYSAVYGAFATVPILLVWIYVAWLVVLLGAVLTAYLPSLTAGPHRRAEGHAWQFQLALQVLQALERARPGARRGLNMAELTLQLQVTDLQLEPVLETLLALDWIARLDEPEHSHDGRFILLADVQSTALEPLMRQLLLPSTEATERLWRSGRLSSVYLRDAI
ncbi:YihY family inner membrane protein [Ramlibacter sp. AN1015]|uniref:YihY family inner membrane protein n=1 Tax=Ramlibacter sp. AN1015 TaxID=3133428 RepID=UPI0030BC35F4